MSEEKAPEEEMTETDKFAKNLSERISCMESIAWFFIKLFAWCIGPPLALITFCLFVGLGLQFAGPIGAVVGGCIWGYIIYEIIDVFKKEK